MSVTRHAGRGRGIASPTALYPRHAQVLLSGAGTAMWNGFRRLDVA